VVKIIQWSF